MSRYKFSFYHLPISLGISNLNYRLKNIWIYMNNYLCIWKVWEKSSERGGSNTKLWKYDFWKLYIYIGGKLVIPRYSPHADWPRVCLVVFSSGPGLHLRARLPVARLCVCKRGVFGCLLHTNQASRRWCLVAWMHRQMQIRMQGLVVWLPAYSLVELPLAWGGEVTINQYISSHI